MPTTGGCWVNMRGSLWRCSNEQMRPATNDESLGAELVNRYLGDMKWDLQHNKGPKKFVDVRVEGAPVFPEDLPDEERADLSDDDEQREPESQPGSELGAPRQPMSEPVTPDTPLSPELPHLASSSSASAMDIQREARERSRSPPATRNVPVAAEELSLPASAMDTQREASATPASSSIAPTRTTQRSTPYPYPFDSKTISLNTFVESTEADAPVFFAHEAVAEYNVSENYFTVKKVPADAEIDIRQLDETARSLFTGKGGSREKEWANMINQVKEVGGPAVRVYRGARAKEIKLNYSHRLIPSRWLDKWKDMGDDFTTPLPPETIKMFDIPEHSGAKSRWILQGFHDPDIAILNRSVPTPETSDVPLVLQMIASLCAKAFVGDIRGAFSQGMRGQRKESLYATPPPGGIPGEGDDIVIEILAEIYGLISGPPGWRRSLAHAFRWCA